MEIDSQHRRSPDGEHFESESLSSISHDSALPTTTPSADLDDDDTENIHFSPPIRSKSTDSRLSRTTSASQPFTIPSTTSSSVDRFKHGIRYITDGLIRKVSKQNNVSRIRSLDLSNLRDKKIRYIENLQVLINLETLNLSNNLIEKIDGLKTLKKLKNLFLANNFIVTLTNLEDLSRLEMFDVHKNQISEIPTWLGKKLTTLKIFNLGQNQISSFDQVAKLRTLYELRELTLAGNPIDQHEHYRLLVISYVPSLERLDGMDVSEQERTQAKEQFIQQEVQNLLHQLERRDNEYRRLNTQATNNEQELEKKTDKLHTLESKTSMQAKEIKSLQESLALSEELLQRKTSLLHQACERQCELEQELAFYKIDLKFDMIDLSKHLNGQTKRTTDSPYIGKSTIKDTEMTANINEQQRHTANKIRWQTAEVQRILGASPEGKFFHPEAESIHNEKLLALSFNKSELSFLQAKYQIIEEHLQTAIQQNESQAVINHLADDLNNLQTEMMNKICDVQELKLALNGMRIDEGRGLGADLEQVTIELKLDEVVQQHVVKLKQQSTARQLRPQECKAGNESTFEQALTEAVSSSGTSVRDQHNSSHVQLLEHVLAANVEQLRVKEVNEQEAQVKITDLQFALERERNEAEKRIQQIEEMAEREKQRILKHLEDEKRFTRDIITKSETMISQLKRELNSERTRKSDEQKTHEALRDIYKKISPRQSKVPSRSITTEKSAADNEEEQDEEEEESHFDGETTVYRKDDPLLASTPRDRPRSPGRNESSDTNDLRHQLEEQLLNDDDDDDASFLNNTDQKMQSTLTTGTLHPCLPPMPKRRLSMKYHQSSTSSSFDKMQPSNTKIEIVSNAGGGGAADGPVDEEENDLLYRLHGYFKAGQVYMSGLGDLARNTVNDSGYSSQQTTRDTKRESNKLQSLLLSTQPFYALDGKYPIDPSQFNRDYTVGVVTAGTNQYRHCDQSKLGNVTLYPTPEGYMLGPHSVTVSPETLPVYANVPSPQSLQQTDSQFFASVKIPPGALSSNRSLATGQHQQQNEVRLQGPIIFRTDAPAASSNVSPISVKLRSLKFPQAEKSTITESDIIRREIDRTSDEIDYLRLKLRRKEDELVKDGTYLRTADFALTHQDDEIHLLRDTLDQQTREIERLKIMHQDMLNSGHDNEANLFNISEQIQRVRRNIHEHLSPALFRVGDTVPQVAATGHLIPLVGDDQLICNVPRHADLEQLVEDQRHEITELKHENRRLERSLAKKSLKIDALDLAESKRRSRSIADSIETENLQDDVYVLEQQLIRKQREITLAQQQLKEMATLSHSVVHDLKTARSRHTIAKRETKVFEQKVESLSRKLFKLTSDTQQAEEQHAQVTAYLRTIENEKVKLDKTIDEKRALSIVLDEQLRASVNSFNTLLHSSIQCLNELTSSSNVIDDEFRLTSLPSLQSQSMSPEEIQRQISYTISENNRVLSRYHAMIKQQKQKSNALKVDITEKETILVNIKSDLNVYNEQLRKNAQELLQEKKILEELERVKEIKSDKLTELERFLDRQHSHEKQAQHELEQLANEQQRLKKQYKDTLSEHDQLQHKIEADRSVLMEMKSEAARLREQIKAFLDDKETLDETVDLLAKKCEALHNECKEKENGMPTLIAQIDEKLVVCRSLEEEIKVLKTEKNRCIQEVTDMKEKIDRKRIELERSSNDNELEQHCDELKQRIRRNEQELGRLNGDIDERNRTLSELNTMIAYARNIMKNVQPTENRHNYKQRSPSSDFPVIDQRHLAENTTYYETKIQRLTKTLDDKEQELRELNMSLIKAKDEVMQMQNKVQNQETNAETIRNSMQLELDKLRHWLQIYENRKAILRPQYHETLKELELKLHEQEMFYRKQIKDLDSEMKRKYHNRTSDDSGFFSDTAIVDHRVSPTIEPNDQAMLREQIQNIFSHHVQELDRCNSKYKNNLSNLKNRLHELENSTASTATFDASSPVFH